MAVLLRLPLLECMPFIRIALLAAVMTPLGAIAGTPALSCPPGMALVRGGEYMMAHGKTPVRVDSLCVDLTEVTVDAWDACVAQGACAAATGRGCNDGVEGRGNHPINCVKWKQADEFCRKAGKRLPSTAEWEWVARGGEKALKHPWGPAPAGDQLCWNGPGNTLGEGKRKSTCPVGSFPASDTTEGIHDLLGNVSEFTADYSYLDLNGASRETRGGAFNELNEPLISSSQSSGSRTERTSPELGFRCVAWPKGAPPKPPPPAPVADPPPGPITGGGMHGCDAGTAFVAGGKLRVAYRADAVTVADLCMDLTPVTVDGWRACVERGACKDPKGRGELCSWERPDHGRHPITCVRQPEAEGYCAAVGGRLPTEEEWEWAARGGARGTAYPWGSQAPRGQLCWSGKAKREGTCAVGTFPQGRSPDGLYDLAGNVEVWTSSSFDPDSSRLRVIRGSAWTTDVSSQVSPAERSRSIPDAEYSRTGLRCVKGPRAVAK